MQQLNNSIIIIIGVTGDLATKNLIPALYELFTEQQNVNFSCIGIAHNSLSILEILQKVRPFLKQFDQKKWDLFIQKWHFLTADITDAKSYAALAEIINKVENNKNSNRIIYCACPPQLFQTVASNCIEHKIIEHKTEHKIVFEKPFGTNAQTAEQLNDELKKLLPDNQIIRADHYLAKELVETVAYLRFTNEFFEPLWNSNHIEYVVITLKETVTVEQRAGLYDTLGVVRDVIQSHALQLLSLVAMEAPVTLEGQYLHAEKLAILKKTTITHALFGQYLGYAAHAGVQPHSTTPTYALITCTIDTPRWQKVPFIIQAGKALDKQATEIKIVFKQPTCKLSTGCPIFHNELIIKIAPRGEFALSVNIKKPSYAHPGLPALQTTQDRPDADNAIMPINLNFCYSCMWPYTPQAYRVIFENLINNVGSISVPFAEIDQAWKIVDSVIQEHTPNLLFYEIGSPGPLQATEYLHALRGVTIKDKP